METREITSDFLPTTQPRVQKESLLCIIWRQIIGLWELYTWHPIHGLICKSCEYHH